MWNGNNYGGYMPYSSPYNGYGNNQGNYMGQAPFVPQNGNYAPQTPAQPQVTQQPAQMNTNKIYVTGIEGARTMQFPPNSTGKMEIKPFKISEYTETEAAPAPAVDMSQFVSVEEFKTVQTEMGRIKRTIDGLLKKEKKGGEENG